MIKTTSAVDKTAQGTAVLEASGNINAGAEAARGRAPPPPDGKARAPLGGSSGRRSAAGIGIWGRRNCLPARLVRWACSWPRDVACPGLSRQRRSVYLPSPAGVTPIILLLLHRGGTRLAVHDNCQALSTGLSDSIMLTPKR